MADTETLKDAVDRRGPYQVWDMLDEEARRQAAEAFWTSADRDSRAALEIALAKELKFRAQSVRKLSVERVVGRLVRMADSLPDTMVFQYLFHLHMGGRRPLMVAYLDAVGLPHEDGVLNLPDDAGIPEADKVEAAAEELIKAHGKEALVYLATLKVADEDFWQGLDETLEKYDADGEAIG